ncbi:MAG: RluA family pseudouridine synthase [Thermogutta sp.]
MSLPNILYEDNHVLVVDKPAGWATMGLPQDRETLLTWLKDFLKKRDSKPGNVYLGVVSRLDVPVSGVVLIAKTSKAAARLAEQFRTRNVSKVYWAVVEGYVQQTQGTLRHFLRGDERFRRVHVTHAHDPNAQEAILVFNRMEVCSGLTLLEVHPHTGRKHQIRIQLATIGHPILGDQKYGAKQPFSGGIALHSRRIEFVHPVRKIPIVVESAVPANWRRLPFAWSQIGQL